MKKKKEKGLLIVLFCLMFLSLSACSQVQSESGNANPSESVNSSEDESIYFSVKGGFYDKKFALTLASNENSEIYYTTDGTDPRTSDTAVLYTQEISIYNNTKDPNVYSAIKDIALGGYEPPKFKVDKGIVIRAVEKDANGNYGEVVTNSYFVGKKASYYSDFRVISMVADTDYLFHPDTGVYMIGSKYYEWLKSSDYVTYDSGDVQNPTNYNQDGKETEFPVAIQVFENGALVYSDNVGARISGNWTRAGAQKSFRLYARKEYGSSKMKYAFFDELKNSDGEVIKKFDKVTIRNGGNDHILHFRDAFIQELSEGLAVDTMASQPCILFLNGEFWGFYLLREKPEDYYIQSHYGIEDEDVAVIKNSSLDSGTEEDLEEYRNFSYWAATADMTVDANYQEFCNQMDLQSFMDYMTVETYINNHDWAVGYVNNWMVWKSKTVNPDIPKADGKWRFIFYDLDFSAGLYGSPETSYKYDGINNVYADDMEFNLPQMLKNLCQNPEFMQKFYDNYVRIVDTCFAPEKVNATLDVYVDKYKEAMIDTHHRFGVNWAADAYDGEVEGLREFFDKRPQYAKKQLDQFISRIEGAKVDTEINTEAKVENLVPEVSSWYYYGDASFSMDKEAGIFYASVPKSQEYSWNIQAGASKIPLKKGQMYRLTFDASCSGLGNLELFINRFDGEGYPTQGISEVVLSEQMATYEFLFSFDMDTQDDWTLCFNFGLGTGDYVIQNVVIENMN